MNRRNFLTLLSILAASGLLPFGRKAFAASLPALPIPNLLKADVDGRIRLKIQKGQSQWRQKPTQTWG